MAKGRKRIPSKIIDLRGGTKLTHRPPRDADPKPPEKMPPCPKVLDEIARKEWKRAGKLLMAIGLLGEIDMVTLAGYCDAYSRWYQATEKVHEMGMVYAEGQKKDKEGNIVKAGIPRLNPFLRIAQAAFEHMMKNACLCGMSPSSRASLKVEKPKEIDLADEFLSQCKK